MATVSIRPNPSEREHEVLHGHVTGDEPQDLLVHGDLVEIHRRHAVLLCEHPRQLFLLHEAEVHQCVANPVAGGLGLGQTFLELHVGDEPFSYEKVAEADFLSGLCCHRHFVLMGDDNRQARRQTRLKDTPPYHVSIRETVPTVRPPHYPRSSTA